MFSATTPRKALNKAFLRLKPRRHDFDTFRTEAAQLLDRIKAGETEEFHKNLISDFLKRTYFAPNYYINTKERSDLVVHNGKEASSPVGVILEIKSPTNRSEMPASSLNTKAMQELLLYFLRERVRRKNLTLRALVITNIYDWYIFDAAEFERHFVTPMLVHQFQEFENQMLSGRSTEFFYREIAGPAIAAIEGQLQVVKFSWTEYRDLLRSSNAAAQRQLIPIFKVLSPEHLLKVPFRTDSESLDRTFYSELLHIIGLLESKAGSRRLIGRKPEGERDEGSLIENAIAQLDTLGKLSRIPRPERFGVDKRQWLFNVALELAITWVDRIIFLKLLEAQLIRYHDGDRSWAFLSLTQIANFDDLNALFFSVLARRLPERSRALAAKYARVPYLNSSLFDPTQVEHETIFLSNLQDGLRITVFRQTVLRNAKGNRLTGELPLLEYLLRFLDAYDFSGEGGEEIQEENKPLINASVLGLFFEKINGYKDGSFFTPGQITMHMCRENVRRAVVDRFNEANGWRCEDLGGVYDRIDNKKAANEVINGITICDPAVGSGHFLVSALNELISIKSDLHILMDGSGRTLRDYTVEIVNDELVVTDEDGRLFTYNPSNSESQRVQEALFHEKQVIIENCLFGVDVNPNSVKICRLRLWIELLKHAYYNRAGDEPELETLPNIDINIKVGNSLVSRFPLDSKVSGILRNSRRSVADYRTAIAAYQAARGSDEKRQFERLIAEIQEEFRSDVYSTLIGNLRGELQRLESQNPLFEETKEKKADTAQRKRKLSLRIEAQEAALAKADVLGTSFEWRFEFPQILDKSGNFVGFDVLLGNPPYGVKLSDDERTFISAQLGKVPDHEIFYMFLNLAHQLLRPRGLVSFILPNTILFNVFAEKYRLAMLEKWDIEEIVDCTDFLIFVDATVRNAILSLRKGATEAPIAFRQAGNALTLADLLKVRLEQVSRTVLSNNNRNWALVFRVPAEVLEVAGRIRDNATPLEAAFPEISQGLIAYDKYQGQSNETIEARIFHSKEKKDDSFKEWLWGEDVRPYVVVWNGKEYIKYGSIGEGIANPREPKFFRGPRILVREITSPRIYAAYTDKEQYNDPAIINILDAPHGPLSIYCLLGILNSKLATFYHLNTSPKITKGTFPKILVADIKTFPIPRTTNNSVATDLVRNVRAIISAVEAGQNTEALELAIDRLVFELYGLPHDDVSLIEAWMQ